MLHPAKFVSCSERYREIDGKNLLNVSRPVVLADVKSPGDFHIQIGDYVEEYTKLLLELNWFYQSLPLRDDGKDYELREFVASTPCVARYPADGVWYRAIITGYSLETKKIAVKFVDYGNVDNLFADNVKRLSRDFFNVPALALSCRLANVKLKSVSLNVWSEAAIEDFRALSELKLQARFVDFDKSTSVWYVNLFTEKTDGEIWTVAKHFQKKQYCKFSPDCVPNGLADASFKNWWHIVTSNDTNTENSKTDISENANSSTDVSENNSKKSDDSHVQNGFPVSKPSCSDIKGSNSAQLLDERTICHVKEVASTSLSTKRVNCEKFVTERSRFSVKHFPPLKIKACRKSFLDVCIVHVESTPNLFSVILAHHVTSFDNLNAKLNRICCSSENRKKLLNPKEGDLCAAKLPDKKSPWYRCIIVECKSRAVLRVYLVDIGRFELVSVADVLVLNEEFRKLFPFAVSCCLTNFQLCLNDDSKMRLLKYLNSCRDVRTPMVLRLESTNAEKDRFSVSLFDQEEKNVLGAYTVKLSNFSCL